MTPDATAAVDEPGPEVMASVDHSPSGSTFVIADVTRDDAWLTVPLAEAPTLGEWC
jgi:hypothetical protein